VTIFVFRAGVMGARNRRSAQLGRNAPNPSLTQGGADRLHLDSEQFRSAPRTCRPVCGKVRVRRLQSPPSKRDAEGGGQC
jgi:hypothetical protein